MPPSDFSFTDFTIRVESADLGDRQWLEENLTPSFRCSAAGAAARIVTKIVDPVRHLAMLDLGPASPSQRVACFCFDGHGGACTRWNVSPMTLYDDELDVFYQSSADGTRVEVLAPSSRPSTRIALLRLVREFATHHLASTGAWQFHAAALELHDHGTLVVGPKRAGKTSFLIHALGEPGSRYIANDRAIVSRDERLGWRLGGMPTVVSIRPGTFDLLDRPGARLAGGWSARMTLDEALETAPERPSASLPRPLSISPRQFCHAVGAARAESSRLRVVVFPRVDPDREGLHVERLSADEAGGRLQAHLFHPTGAVFRSDVSGPRDAENQAERLAELSASIPAYECVLGRGAYSGGSARSVLSELFDLSSDGFRSS